MKMNITKLIYDYCVMVKNNYIMDITTVSNLVRLKTSIFIIYFCQTGTLQGLI